MKKSIQLATVLTTRLSCFTTLLLSLLVAANASATVVTNNTQSALMTALAGGGTVTFGIDGTFNLTNTLVIATNVTLDGAGHTISISGGNAVRVFFVNPGINFTLKNVSIIKGSVVGINSTNTAFGGGIFNNGGNVLLTNCTLSGNTVTGYLGPMNGPPSTPAAGGAIFNQNGTLTLIRTTFVTNSAFGGSSSWYSGSTSSGFGGGIFNLGTLAATNCAFVSNSAFGGNFGAQPGDGDGGAIYNMGTATVVGASMIGNYVISGIAEETGFGGTGPSGTANGGGIYNSNTLVLLGSTLSSNMAIGTSASDNPGFGPLIAGDASGGGIFNVASVHATNNTFVGNSTTGGSNDRGSSSGSSGGNARGGAFYHRGGTAILAFQTIFANVALGGTSPGGTNGLSLGGGIFATNGSLTLLNSIVASNAYGGDFYVLSNSVTDGGNNISSDNSFPFTALGSRNNINPLLGPLGNNGGPTLTMTLLPGSPAIDAASGTSSTPTDQRGLPRPYGSASDIGAFEFYPSYSIQGVVRGLPPSSSATVSAGIFSGVTDSSGNYVLNSLTNGIYPVTPSATGFVFIPPNQTVNVLTNTASIDFAAYSLNTLTVESYANGVLHLAFAGTNGQIEIVQSSSTLSNWSPLLTNTLGASGIFEFTVTNSPGQPIRFFRAHSP